METKLRTKYTITFDDVGSITERYDRMSVFRDRMKQEKASGVAVKTGIDFNKGTALLHFYQNITETFKKNLEKFLEGLHAQISKTEYYNLLNYTTTVLKPKKLESAEDVDKTKQFFFTLDKKLIDMGLYPIELTMAKDDFIYLQIYNILDEDQSKVIHNAILEITKSYESLFKLNEEGKIFNVREFKIIKQFD